MTRCLNGAVDAAANAIIIAMTAMVRIDASFIVCWGCLCERVVGWLIEMGIVVDRCVIRERNGRTWRHTLYDEKIVSSEVKSM